MQKLKQRLFWGAIVFIPLSILLFAGNATPTLSLTFLIVGILSGVGWYFLWQSGHKTISRPRENSIRVQSQRRNEE